ncbi:hypothetical protein L6452_37123 [Arctium lappa]|uniref:Uncharacterized protein n=1 Tax=Arctium lappa TaxID=4217 RepID=A0ACB8Y253_ARCLA|nr:hypothetical protein L6452_37123 [Arctium lappa]
MTREVAIIIPSSSQISKLDFADPLYLHLAFNPNFHILIYRGSSHLSPLPKRQLRLRDAVFLYEAGTPLNRSSSGSGFAAIEPIIDCGFVIHLSFYLVLCSSSSQPSKSITFSHRISQF